MIAGQTTAVRPGRTRDTHTRKPPESLALRVAMATAIRDEIIAHDERGDDLTAAQIGRMLGDRNLTHTRRDVLSICRLEVTHLSLDRLSQFLSALKIRPRWAFDHPSARRAA